MLLENRNVSPEFDMILYMPIGRMPDIDFFEIHYKTTIQHKFEYNENSSFMRHIYIKQQWPIVQI